VAGDTSIRFKLTRDAAVGRVDFSKYRFVRREHFEISRKNPRSDRFNPEPNLVSVDRFDTVELAD